VTTDLLLDDANFCKELRSPEDLKSGRIYALKMFTMKLQRVYNKKVVVLVDEYDSPMHYAIEHGYTTLVRF
jgi:hypothetical protein